MSLLNPLLMEVQEGILNDEENRIFNPTYCNFIFLECYETLSLICKMHDSCTCSDHCAYFIKDSIQFQEINVEIQCCATNTGTITENGTDRVRTSLDQDWYPALTYKAL